MVSQKSTGDVLTAVVSCQFFFAKIFKNKYAYYFI